MVSFPKFKNYKEVLIHITDINDGNFSPNFDNQKTLKYRKQQLALRYGLNYKNIFEMEQVHSNKIKILRNYDIKKLKDNIISDCDGLITDVKNVFLMVRTADCYPIIFYCPKNQVLAAIHAGRVGLSKGILINVINKMAKFDCQPKEILVMIGPGIGKCCYNKDLLDIVKKQLIKLGIKIKKIQINNVCTCCSKDYYSHVRSLKNNEVEGRFATIVGLKN